MRPGFAAAGVRAAGGVPSRCPSRRGLQAGEGWRWKIYWGELMRQLGNNSICALHPAGPPCRGAGRQRGSCPITPAPSPLPQQSFFGGLGPAWWVLGELGRGSALAGSLARRHQRRSLERPAKRWVQGRAAESSISAPESCPPGRGSGGDGRFLARRAACRHLTLSLSCLGAAGTWRLPRLCKLIPSR